jgi:hypothetical protein
MALQHSAILETNLTLEGLRIIYEINNDVAAS